MNLYRLEKTFGFSFLFLVIFLWYYQILRGEYFSSLSEKNRIRVIPLFAERGKILDRKGRVLATQEPVLNIVANPAELKNKEEVFREVSSVLGISEEELFMRYKENLTSPFMPIVLVRDIPLEKLFLIEEKRPAFSGIEIEINQKRFYPFGSAGAHLLGYLGEIGPEELLKWKPYGYRIKNLLGKMGIEKSLETYLRGEDGARIIEVDNLGNLVRIMGEKKPIPGKTVQLSIDGEWQKIAHRLLNGKRGAILIMDVQTGEILVLESSPSFDPNLFSSREARKIRLLLNSPQAILLNRATQVNIPPGAVGEKVAVVIGEARSPAMPEEGMVIVGEVFAVELPKNFQELSAPATLIMRYPPELVPFIELESLAIQRWNAEAARWEGLESGSKLDRERRAVIAQTSHLSRFALLARRTFEIPTPAPTEESLQAGPEELPPPSLTEIVISPVILYLSLAIIIFALFGLAALVVIYLVRRRAF
ncbi:MAG: penicillin-binding transpeptidase domain-containing protein [Candidatus Omnitrophica bacterium]|nr:penicillin-binding transpeptidase domain-containing protein [Candidatus Omnitrophota bacterium]